VPWQSQPLYGQSVILPGAREFRAGFNRLESTDAQCTAVRQFFAEQNNKGEGVAA